MKIDQAEVVNDSGRNLPKVPPRIASVFINFMVFTSWQRLLSVDQTEVDKDSDRKLPKVPPKDCERVH